jgi:hypothetical protein
MSLADTDNNGAYSESELNALTKAQLLDLCTELGVEGVTSANLKADIITAILNR